MHIKAEGMTQFDIFHVFVENSVTSDLCFLKFIQKCPCSNSLKKFQWTQKNVWPLIRKILIWTFWNYKSSWSKKSTPIQPGGVIGALPPTMYFQKIQFLGVFRPFLQRPLANGRRLQGICFLEIFQKKFQLILTVRKNWKQIPPYKRVEKRYLFIGANLSQESLISGRKKVQ